MTKLSATRLTATALMISASSLAISIPASAHEMLFASNGETDVKTGTRVTQTAGLTQVKLDNGARLSFVDNASYRINADGTVDLYLGSVTVAGANGATALVRMPDGVEGSVTGTGSAASFSVSAKNESRGHILAGRVTILNNRMRRTYTANQMWSADGGRLQQAVSIGEQVAPEVTAQPGVSAPPEVLVADMRKGGPVAAAQNGLPVSLGDALAGAGASSDIVAAARRVEAANGNPVIETYPIGDLAMLGQRASDLETLYGGRPFPQAQADIIRAYLGFLAGGGSGADFVTAYSGFLVQYLGLIRAGALPSSFQAASVADINAFLAYQGRTGALAALSSQNRALAEAYLAFLQNGGNPNAFSSSYTDLVNAYFAFVRGGGDPLAFNGASNQVLGSYILFLRQSGLAGQLSASNQVLLNAYLANGGLGFTNTYGIALNDYFAYLQAGNLPSNYTALSSAQLRNYLETLQAAGLLNQVLGARAAFYTDYLAFLQDGGNADNFGQLNANIFAGYAGQLNIYFAFLAGGGLPSDFSGDVALLNSYLATLQSNGALAAFLGGNSAFFTDYLAFLQGGGLPDAYTGLNANIFAGYSVQLAAYYDYLLQGGVPSAYGALTQQQIAAYVAALRTAGASGLFLDDLDGFYAGYLAYLQTGANPDVYTGLPVLNLPVFADALNVFALFLAGGGLPSGFTATELAVLQSYLDALSRSGQLTALLGGNADLLNGYFAFFTNAASADNFAGLPIYATYVSALNSYYAFLDGGGLPADYTALTPAQIEAYLDALNGAGGLAGFANLNLFFGDYYAFIAGGGEPADFAGIPVYANYLSAVAAFYAHLAGGGLPSGYTALTPAQVQAYLDALAGAGLLAANFEGEVLAFYTDYLAYLVGGGVPDNFGGLPDGTAEQLAGINAWIFGVDALRTNNATDADIDDDGRITKVVLKSTSGNQTYDYTARTADLREHGRVGNTIGWTRYYTGATNNGSNVSEHLLVGTPAVNLPTSGTATYTLIGGTAPTDRRDVAGSVGYFTGALGVAFGTTALVGVNFDVLSGTEGYRVKTAGGAANPANGGMGVSANGTFENQNIGLTKLTDSACTAFCQAQVFGGLFGDGASHAGFTYNIFDQGASNAIQGVAVFGTTGTVIAGLGTMPVTGGGVPQGIGTPLLLNDPANFTATSGVKFALSGPFTGLSGFTAINPVFAANQGLSSIEDGINTRTVGTATATDISTNARFAIGRWTDGTYTVTSQTENSVLTSAQGLHYLFAGPTTSGVFAVPATGQISYELIAATAPTIADGSLAPGRFQADMAVLFGSTRKVAMEGSITLPKAGGDYVYGFSTLGGIDNPSQTDREFRITQGRNVNFEVLGSGITTSDNGCNADCTIQFTGYFAGDNVNQLGLLYTAYGLTNAKKISGAAIFGAVIPAGPVVNATTGNLPNTTVSTDLFVADGHLFSLDYSTANPNRTDSLDLVKNNSTIGASYKTNANGQVIEITRTSNGWRDYIAPVAANFGAASNTDIGRTTSGAVRWSRWSNGGVVPSRFGPPPAFSADANQGYHIIIGTPSSNLPATGRIDYTLAGGTSPTAVNGSASPGTLVSGLAAVEFGSTSRVGIELVMDYDASRLTAKTTGGVANLATSELTLTNGGFDALSPAGSVTSTGTTCAGATCSVQWTGFLAGNGGKELGVQYDIKSGNTALVIGAAAFTETPAATGFARFDDADPASVGLSPQTGLPVAVTAIDANAMLGGMITFGGQ